MQILPRRARWGAILLVAMLPMDIHAQSETHVLAPGRPPLTSEMTAKTAGFFEWALDLRFTQEQTAAFLQMVVRDWADAHKRRSTLELLSTIDKLFASSPETREHVKAQFSRNLVDGLRKSTEDAQARWLLAIYDETHHPNVVLRTAALSGGSFAERLTGKWRATSVAATQYKNSYTGAPAPTSGNSFFYEFFPDGTYRNNNMMQITTYGCTSSIYGENSGRFRVQGDHLYVEPSRGTVKSQVCGGQPSEKADNLAVREYVFHIETTGGREVLVVNGVDGKTRPDYFRREIE